MLLREQSVYDTFLLPFLLQQLQQRLLNLRHINRLGNMTVHACIKGVLLVLLKGIRRHRHNRDRGLLFIGKAPDSLRRLIAVHMRHLHVHENQVIGACRLLLHAADALHAILDALHHKSHAAKNIQRNLCVQVIILGQQNVLALERLLIFLRQLFLLRP